MGGDPSRRVVSARAADRDDRDLRTPRRSIAARRALPPRRHPPPPQLAPRPLRHRGPGSGRGGLPRLGRGGRPGDLAGAPPLAHRLRRLAVQRPVLVRRQPAADFARGAGARRPARRGRARAAARKRGLAGGLHGGARRQGGDAARLLPAVSERAAARSPGGASTSSRAWPRPRPGSTTGASSRRCASASAASRGRNGIGVSHGASRTLFLRYGASSTTRSPSTATCSGSSSASGRR